MKNNRGFISISLIYSFVIIMLLLLVLVLGRLLNNRLTFTVANDELKQSSYEKNFEIPLPVGEEKPVIPPPPVDPPEPEIPVDDGYWFYEEYSSTGSGYKKIVIERSGYYYIELLGAQGGTGMNNGSSNGTGGKGARVTGEIYLSSGEVLYAYIGGQGENAKDRELGANGGYNGGGAGGDDSNVEKNKNEPGGGGGGATDIRCFYNSSTGKCVENNSNLDWDDPIGLNSRIMVAGGGGGGNFAGDGGAGGIKTGGTGVGEVISLPSQTSGNAFGYGGKGGECTDGGGGGGGGWYGGGGGVGCGDGGSGGSSYISGYNGCNTVRTLTDIASPRTPKCQSGTESSDVNCSIHPSGKTFRNINVTEGYNTGHGNFLITYVNPAFENPGNIPNIAYEYTTSGEKTLTIPRSGIYKLEVWGGQGGGKDNNGGYGGYSVGYAVFNQNQKLYINVGGQGESKSRSGSDTRAAGGYNGGGTGRIYRMSSSYNNFVTGGGGGATHIATTSGLLSSLSSSKDSILIVAGGGGGGANNGGGGHAGGYLGNTGGCNEGEDGHQGSGGSQTAGGKGLNLSGNYAVGGFGQGSESGTGGTRYRYGGAGGGGWYGGGGNNPGSKCGGGGGSGYIGNKKLINFRDKTKYMVCFNCDPSSSYSTYTVKNTNSSSTPVADKSKTGVGAARITFVG